MSRKSFVRRIGNVDIKLLNVFRTVAACEGFTAAEFELNIGRSTISKYVLDLESRLGLKLCHRGPAGFALTADGRLVLEAAQELFDAIESFNDRVNDTHADLKGVLKIAYLDHSSTNPEAKLDDAIRAFCKRAPGVVLEVYQQPANVIEENVISGKYNLGIVPLHRESPMLLYSELYSEEMRLYCGATHPLRARLEQEITLDTLRGYAFAGYAWSSQNMLNHQRLNFRNKAHVENEEALTMLILSGCFLGFLPVHMAGPLVEAGQIAEIRHPETVYSAQMAAITRRGMSGGRRQSVFLKCLEAAHRAGEPDAGKAMAAGPRTRTA